MARIFTEGFELGAGLQGMTVVTAGFAVQTDAKSWGKGTYCGRLSGTGNPGSLGTNEQTAEKSFTALAEAYLRISVKLLTNESSTFNVISLMDSAGATVAGIQRDGGASTGSLHTLNGRKGGSTIGAITTIDDDWHALQLHIVNTTGAFEFEVRVDGSLLLSYSDSTPVGAGNIAKIEFRQNGTYLSLMDFRFDDLAINDTTTGVDNSWVEEGSVMALMPNGNGDLSQWTGSDSDQTDNYLLVDERPPNDDTDYVYGTADGQVDLYNTTFSSLSSGESVTRVWACAVARKAGVSSFNYQPAFKSGATITYEATAPPQSTGYAFHASVPRTLNPTTAAPWTEGDLDNLQVGARLVVT